VSRKLSVAVIQMAMGDDVHENVARAGQLASEAAQAGAQVVLPPELFAGRYFPAHPERDASALCQPPERSEPVQAMRVLAAALGVVIPVSYYERDGERRYNSLLVWGPDGEELGRYRKSHIPDGEGYEEKRFFDAGDTGFRVFDTPFGRLGAAICWDQWFPECARAMALSGAELLLYPSAIGSEPGRPELDTAAPWRRVMVGHAVANTIPVAASNRVGDEEGQHFFGTSFICDGYGEIVAECDRQQEGFALTTFDLDHWAKERDFMGLHRDRRPDLYGPLAR
jgi:N-carbamoylputrescine amidase